MSSSATLSGLVKPSVPPLRIPLRIWVDVYCGTIHNSQVMETAKMPQH
jgi:hypothetical protein